jgi:hypothetical protein
MSVNTVPKFARLATSCVVVATLVSVVQASTQSDAGASGTVCGSFCSGSDGTTGTNVGGNGPQVYIGEVGTGANAAKGTPGPCTSDPDTMCFNTTGANSARSRFNAGTGQGVAYYFQMYGPSWNGIPTGLDAYCWGQFQAISAVHNTIVYFDTYTTSPQNSLMSIDIESDSSYGWVVGNYANNRLAFNGFTDYVAGRNSADSSCPNFNGVWDFQYMLYASNYTWNYLTNSGGNGSIANTPIWTTEPHCAYSSLPTSMSPAATWNDGGTVPVWGAFSNYLENWQFDVCSSGDYDIGPNTWYLPVFGINMQ